MGHFNKIYAMMWAATGHKLCCPRWEADSMECVVQPQALRRQFKFDLGEMITNLFLMASKHEMNK
ncbi:hypothetical protein AAMO2058_001400000 [Amorphochlora amoebiformis]